MATGRKTASTSWKKHLWHEAHLPSGMVVELRIPGLTELVRNDAVPERLRAIALKAAAHPGGIRGLIAEKLKVRLEAEQNGDASAEELAPEVQEAIEELAEMTKFLIVENVRVDGIHPTAEELDDEDLIPAPDKELLGAIMLRETAYDAKGVRLGVEPLDSWERFRHHHDCDSACVACTALQIEFSSADLGAL